MKSKVDKLDVDKLVPVPFDLSELSDKVKNDVFNIYIYNAKIKDIEDKISDITNLATNNTLNSKTNEVKNKIRNITNLATDIVSTAVGNKIPDHSKYITTREFNKLIAENLNARLKQANLATNGVIADFVKKTDFAEKLKSSIKKVA